MSALADLHSVLCHRIGSMVALALAAILSGPIPCDVVRVLDGDTVEVRCRAWLGTDVTTIVRVRGIDTPEKHGKCPEESALALKASAFTKEALPQGARVQISEIDNDKFGGRVDAVVVYGASGQGMKLSDQLVKAGLARPYNGGTKSSWCKP